MPLALSWSLKRCTIKRARKEIDNRELGNDDGDVNENGKKKKNRLNRQNNNSASASEAFLYISLPSMHEYGVKMPLNSRSKS